MRICSPPSAACYTTASSVRSRARSRAASRCAAFAKASKTMGSKSRMTKRSGRAEVRALGLADRERWHELWRGYLEFYRYQLPADLTELTWQRLLDPAHPFQGLVALDGERIVGIVHFHVHASTWARVG